MIYLKCEPKHTTLLDSKSQRIPIVYGLRDPTPQCGLSWSGPEWPCLLLHFLVPQIPTLFVNAANFIPLHTPCHFSSLQLFSGCFNWSEPLDNSKLSVKVRLVHFFQKDFSWHLPRPHWVSSSLQSCVGNTCSHHIINELTDVHQYITLVHSPYYAGVMCSHVWFPHCSVSSTFI